MTDKQIAFLKKWCGLSDDKIADLTYDEASAMIKRKTDEWAERKAAMERTKEIITERNEKRSRW